MGSKLFKYKFNTNTSEGFKTTAFPAAMAEATGTIDVYIG
jgi:hypothetical protein